MFIIDLLQPTTEAFTIFIVNKAERGNTYILFPLLLGACWFYRARLNYRRRLWLRLSSGEQHRRQRLANCTGRRNEAYPL